MPEESRPALVADVPPRAQPPALTTNVSHRAVGSRLVRSSYWELEQSLKFGTVTVIVPEGITATVEGGGMFASQVIEPPGAPPVPGSPRLRIRVSGPGGTLYVRSHSSSRR